MLQSHLTNRSSQQGKPSKQNGDILVESLIGLLLFAIAGMGAAHMAGKTAVAQRDSKVQNQVINDLRSRVISLSNYEDLCGVADPALANTYLGDQVNLTAASCDLTTATITTEAGDITINDIYAPVVLVSTVEQNAISVGGNAQ